MEQQIIEIIVDENNQQLELFGTPMFPCKACYSDVNKFVTGDISWHWHEEIEVIRVKSGSIHLYLDNCDFVLNEGDGVFINSNIIHYIRARTSEECILNSLVFNKNLISGGVQSVFEQKQMEGTGFSMLRRKKAGTGVSGERISCRLSRKNDAERTGRRFKRCV